MQLQYFQFTKTGFSPFKNFKNINRMSEIVESCYFYEKIKNKPLKLFGDSEIRVLQIIRLSAKFYFDKFVG